MGLQPLCSEILMCLWQLNHWCWNLADVIVTFLPCRLLWQWRCHHLTKPPWQLSEQPWQDRDNRSGEWEDIEAGVHCLHCILGIHLSGGLCQNHWRGRDNLDGQELRFLYMVSIFSLLLCTTNHNIQKQQSGDLLPHECQRSKVWLESQLECSDRVRGLTRATT